MKDKALSDLLTAARSKPPLRRSPLYKWLHANRRRIAKMLDHENPSWVVIAESVAASGVVNTKGGPPSPDSIRRVWACVTKDAAVSKSQREKARLQPSRLPVTARPPIVEPRRPVEQPRYPPADQSNAPKPELNDAARETLASLREQLEHSDRFLMMPKRKE